LSFAKRFVLTAKAISFICVLKCAFKNKQCCLLCKNLYPLWQVQIKPVLAGSLDFYEEPQVLKKQIRAVPVPG
jgi:hypothetical protein